MTFFTSFELDQPEENLTGSSFVLEDVPKTQIEIIHEQGKLEFGKEFRCYICTNIFCHSCQKYFSCFHLVISDRK